MFTYNDILYPKGLLCVYILPVDGSRKPKQVEEIITTNQIFVHE